MLFDKFRRNFRGLLLRPDTDLSSVNFYIFYLTLDYMNPLSGWLLGSHIVERKRVRPHDVYYLCDVCRFKESDAFVGYQKDVAAAVVFQASNQLSKRLRCGASGRRQLWESALERGLLGDHPLYQLAEEKEGSETWKNAVIGERADLQ